MKPEQPRESRYVDFERAERDPIGVEHDLLTATEEGTGQQTLERAQVVARGLPPPDDPDEPVVNGYKGGDRRLEPSIEEIKRAQIPHAPRQDY
jgi:hypothetical protein